MQKTPGTSGSVPADHHRPSLGLELVMLSVPLIWGMNFSIMKNLYAWFDPLAFAALRFTVGIVTLTAFMKFRNISLEVERRDLPALAGLGFLSNTIYQILFVLGLANTKAGNGGLLMASTPVFAYIVGLILKRERFSRRVLGGILLSTAGVIAIVVFGTREVSLGANWQGDGMILAAALCWGWYTGSASRLILKYGALRVTYWLMLSGTVLLIPPVMPSLIRQDWAAIPMIGWLSFAYSAFLSIVYCYVVWSYAIQRVGVARTAIYSNITPLIALLGGWMLLGEKPVAGQISGIVFILAGVFLVRLNKPVLMEPIKAGKSA